MVLERGKVMSGDADKSIIGFKSMIMALFDAAHVLIAISLLFYMGDDGNSIFTTPIIEHGEQYEWLIFSDVLPPIV